jgi:hypothetical protein
MRIGRIPEQVLPLFVVLVIAVVALVQARRLFVPETFGDRGHFRAAAIDSVLAQPIKYAGSLECQECHDEVSELKATSYHRSLACEVCHGAAKDHVDDPGEVSPTIPRGRNQCLYCHSYLPSRPTGFPQIVELTHNAPEQCTNCHDPHDPTPPHTPGTCSACHANIARTIAVSHHHSLECEVCHETQPEHKTDPRAFPPKKPAVRDFCGDCHGQDAQSPPKIPRVDLATHGGRYLCWQCHYPHFPEGR